jgi:hypothetical protein
MENNNVIYITNGFIVIKFRVRIPYYVRVF